MLKCPEMLRGPQIQSVADQCRCGEDAFAEIGLMENFGLVAASFDHRHLAGKGRDVNTSSRRHGRSVIAADGVEAFLKIELLAGLRVERREHAPILEEVETAFIKKRRWNVRQAARVFPRKMI